MATILLVEDEPAIAAVLEHSLVAAGYTVFTAGDEESGLAKARDIIPDLIIMDLSATSDHGEAATRLLKADPYTCHIPVLALTDDDCDLDSESPFDPNALDALLADPKTIH